MEFPDFSNPSVWISLLTLTFLEIILGVDNIIFISIVANKLPQQQQARARYIGLLLAMGFRVLLLLTITWIIRLTTPVITLGFIPTDKGEPFGLSWKDIILLLGGIFLIIKSTLEIHHKLEKATVAESGSPAYSTLRAVIVQIVLVDAVFSFDSILTAIGLVDNVLVMIIAVIVSILVMMAFSGAISQFINRHPTLQMLALAFLIVIGVLLVAEGFHQKISKSYVYTAIAFSLLVELLNMRLRRTSNPVKLRTNIEDDQKK